METKKEYIDRTIETGLMSENEHIKKDFELIKSLYHGNHISKNDFMRLKIVILSLKQAMEIRIK